MLYDKEKEFIELSCILVLMIQNIKAMHKKSQETSRALMDMVQELSEITESSTKSNEQIVRETGNVLESFSSNTNEITSANERTQDINARLEELASINVEVSELARKVNELSKDNQSNMDHASRRIIRYYRRLSK